MNGLPSCAHSSFRALPLFCLAYPIHVTLPFSDSSVLQRLRRASQREALAENRGGWSLEPGLPTSDCLLRATAAASYLSVLPEESWSRLFNLAAELLKFLASSNGVEGRHSEAEEFAWGCLSEEQSQALNSRGVAWYSCTRLPGWWMRWAAVNKAARNGGCWDSQYTFLFINCWWVKSLVLGLTGRVRNLRQKIILFSMGKFYDLVKISTCLL